MTPLLFWAVVFALALYVLRPRVAAINYGDDLRRFLREAGPLNGSLPLEPCATADERRAYRHHIPVPSNGPGPWRSFCDIPMPEDHHEVRTRGPVEVCETCGNAFKTWRRARHN